MAANCVLTAFVPLASNGGTWAFGGGVPIGGGLGNPRPLDLSWVPGFSYVLERHCQKG
jgi:hypothetical protein